MTSTEGSISTINSEITALETDVADKASSSAVSTLENRVTDNETGLTSVN